MKDIKTYINENIFSQDSQKKIEDLTKETYGLLKKKLIELTDDFHELIPFSSLRELLERGRKHVSPSIKEFDEDPIGRGVLDYICNHMKIDMVWNDEDHIDDDEEEQEMNSDFISELPIYVITKREIKRHLLDQKDPYYDAFRYVDGLDKANYAYLVRDGINEEEIWIMYDDGKAKSTEEKDFIFTLLNSIR